MSNRVDFDKLRKKRQRTQTVKRLIALTMVLAAIGCVIMLNAFFVGEGVTIRIADMFESFGGSGYPVSVPGGIVREVKTFGTDLAILNDTNLYIYTKNGKMIANIQQPNDQVVLEIGGDRVLTYAIGTRQYTIQARSRQLLKGEAEYTLQGGAINGRGDYALITDSSQSVSQVQVYNKSFQTIYEWFSSEQVADVSLAPKENRMAAGCISTRGGVGYSILYLFDFGMDRELAKIELPGEMIYNLKFLDDGRLSVLTDSAYRIYTSSGTEENRYEFGESSIQAIERSGREAVLLLRDGSEYTIVLLNTNCNELASRTFSQKWKDIAFDGSNVYLLTDTGITTYNHSLEEKAVYEKRGIRKIHTVKSRVYYLDSDEIRVLGDDT